MKRVENTGKYMAERLWGDLDDAPTEKEIQDYFAQVKRGEQPSSTLLKKKR
jgi:hypothetical protein